MMSEPGRLPTRALGSAGGRPRPAPRCCASRPRDRPGRLRVRQRAVGAKAVRSGRVVLRAARFEGSRPPPQRVPRDAAAAEAPSAIELGPRDEVVVVLAHLVGRGRRSAPNPGGDRSSSSSGEDVLDGRLTCQRPSRPGSVRAGRRPVVGPVELRAREALHEPAEQCLVTRVRAQRDLWLLAIPAERALAQQDAGEESLVERSSSMRSERRPLLGLFHHAERAT